MKTAEEALAINLVYKNNNADPLHKTLSSPTNEREEREREKKENLIEGK